MNLFYKSQYFLIVTVTVTFLLSNGQQLDDNSADMQADLEPMVWSHYLENYVLR